jgi:hypothetical protein
MIDDPSRVVSLAEYPTDEVPELDLLACLTDRMDTDTIPPEVLVRMTYNAINRHAKDKQGFRSHLLVTDSVSSGAHISTSSGALADGGSNCRLASSEMRVDIEAIVRYRMYRIPLGTVGAMVNTQFGSAIASVHSNALIGTGKTIHSVAQTEVSHNDVHDMSMRDDDQQPTSAADWYPTTLDKDEWDNLPHISPTSAADWYPTTLDKNEWDNLHHFSPLSAADRDPTTLGRDLDDDDACRNALTDKTDSIHINAGRLTQANEVDYRETFQYMTQYVHLPGSEILKKHYKSPFRALTVFRRDVPFEKQLVHVLAPSSFNLGLGLLDGQSTCELRLAPIDICPVQGDFTT